MVEHIFKKGKTTTKTIKQVKLLFCILYKFHNSYFVMYVFLVVWVIHIFCIFSISLFRKHIRKYVRKHVRKHNCVEAVHVRGAARPAELAQVAGLAKHSLTCSSICS